MYIIIIGAGEIGYFLARRLSKDKHTIALVEKDKHVCEEISKESDIMVIHGDGCDTRTLVDAGIDRADVVAAVTGDDEDNLIVSQLAKEKFSVSRTVARVNDPKNEIIFTELGVDVPVDSTAIIAKIIEEEVSFSDLVTLMSFKRGKLAIVRVDLPEGSPIIDKKVQDIVLPADSVFVSVIRGNEVIVPKGNTILRANDDIVALTLVQNEKQLLQALIGKT